LKVEVEEEIMVEVERVAEEVAEATAIASLK
jgi:hypothetical protein